MFVCVYALILFLSFSQFLTDMPGLDKLNRSGGTDFDWILCVAFVGKDKQHL